MIDLGVLILLLLCTLHARVLIQKQGWVHGSTGPLVSTLHVDGVGGDKQWARNGRFSNILQVRTSICATLETVIYKDRQSATEEERERGEGFMHNQDISR